MLNNGYAANIKKHYSISKYNVTGKKSDAKGTDNIVTGDLQLHQAALTVNVGVQ